LTIRPSRFSNRACELLRRLSIGEKIRLLSGDGVWRTKDCSARGLPSLFLCDGPHGLRKQDNSASVRMGNPSIRTVCFPCACATANSWDESLLFEIGRRLGELARSGQVDIVLGPSVNIKRNPLCGRNFEYFSEDPLLSGRLGAAWVRGLQGQGVGASVKHFCANNQETDRTRSSSVLDERTLREIYLKPFDIIVREADPATLMCSYNRLNGTYLSDSRRFLHDIPVGEWGFRGFVLSDWGAVHDRVAGIRAGLALEMPGTGFFDRSIRRALRRGDLAESDLDACLSPMVEWILARATTPGAPDEPAGAPDSGAPDEPAGAPDSGASASAASSLDEHHRFAREAAARCAVLLKNDGLLPLRPDDSFCVIGAFAETPRFQGAGSSAIHPYQVDSLLGSLRAVRADIPYSRGFAQDGDTDDATGDAALAVAADCDIVVVAVGLPDAEESEGFDRPHMRLPVVQDELVRRLCALEKRVAVVLSAGSVVEMPWADEVRAILHMHLGGEAAGSACADLLLGAANPGGKLAESHPFQYDDHITSRFWLESETQSFYREGLFVGYRYYDSAGRAVRFPFGHGLSYTRFAYDRLAVASGEDAIDLSFALTNTGDRDGEEIVQVYLSDRTRSVFKPEQELAAFRKIPLARGETKPVAIRLPHSAFAHYDVEAGGWRIANGLYEIRIGASSRDIRLVWPLSVDFGQAYAPAPAGWYRTLEGTPGIGDLQRLFPDPIVPEPPYRRGTYDVNASLGQMAGDSWFVRLLLRLSAGIIARDLGIRPDPRNPKYRMMMASARDSSLRTLMLMSPERMPKALARFLLFTANGGFRRHRGQRDGSTY